ncbi:MAG: cation:proton antiporter [Hyphomicrobiales bacterium]|nr:cation:proton antiporter [Hyphomicrobiales bacterium]
MTAAFDWHEYKEPLLFLGTAGVVVPLFRLLRVSPVIGFLAAGAALGPFGLGRLVGQYPALANFTIGDVERASRLAEFGVVFLLFMIGLELSWERLVRMRRLVFGLGGAQVMLTTLTLTEIANVWLRMPLGASIVGSAALAMSSTAIVIPVLSEKRRLNRAAGRTAFAVLLFQDLMVAPLLFMVPLIAARAAPPSLAVMFWTWAPAMAFLFLLLASGRILLRPLFRLVAEARSTELFMAACLLVVVGASIASAAAGLSMALGAFIAGLLLGETEFRREIEVTVEPFQGLLLGLFFLSIGAGLDFGRVLSAPHIILGGAVALIVLKAIVTFLLARAFGVARGAAAEAALLLAPGGEFAFLMFGAAIAARLIPQGVGGDAMLIVTLTMASIPALGALGARLQPTQKKDLAEFAHLAPEGSVADERVIIVGYGRVGRLVGEMLKAHQIAFVAVDGDPKIVAQAREEGVYAYWGNATRPEFLEKVGISGARALVVTMDAPLAVEQATTAAHAIRPDMTIVARARDAVHATHLYELGVTDAIPETIEASLQLAEATLVDIGVPMGYVIASIHEKRDEYRKFLQPHGDRRREKRGVKMSTRVRDMRRAKPETKADAEPPLAGEDAPSRDGAS